MSCPPRLVRESHLHLYLYTWYSPRLARACFLHNAVEAMDVPQKEWTLPLIWIWLVDTILKSLMINMFTNIIHMFELNPIWKLSKQFFVVSWLQHESLWLTFAYQTCWCKTVMSYQHYKAWFWRTTMLSGCLNLIHDVGEDTIGCTLHLWILAILNNFHS
jgi:hypothetical protein